MEIRMQIIKYAVFAVFSAVFLRLGYLQLFHGEKYLKQSEDNRLLVEEIAPVRGLIFDRNGEVLVENVPSYSLVASPAEILKHPEALRRLREILGEDEDSGWEAQARKFYGKSQEIRLMRDMDFVHLAAVEANRAFLPGVEIKIESKRSYPYKTAIHALGYLGEISPDELSSYQGLLAGDIVGKKGVEKTYNTALFGRRGYRIIEVDAAGNKVGDVDKAAHIPSINGNDIFLTLDLDLQLLAEELLGERKGAVVALDPSSGDVLVMVSKPAYDPEVFAGVLKSEQWQALLDDPGKPLLNRALQGCYPPGSTIKMSLLTAGLEEEEITTNRSFTCPGYMPMGNRVFKCWRTGGHGRMFPIPAIEQSCDVFFYHLGLAVGIENMAKYQRKYGFGSPSGIDLEAESAGLAPDSLYMNRRYGRGRWSRGNLLNLAIGQGDMLVTPMQLAMYGTALANRGKVPIPHLLKGVQYHNPEKWEAYKPSFRQIEGISPETYEIVRQGMYEVVQGARGTAHWLMDKELEVAGKTGTAQNPHGKDHAWFIGFAPFEAPAIVACALVEHGEHGSSAAAPIVVKIIRQYLKQEVPSDTAVAVQRRDVTIEE